MGCEYFDNFLFNRGEAEMQWLVRDKKITILVRNSSWVMIIE